jgi:hypothetical protein
VFSAEVSVEGDVGVANAVVVGSDVTTQP